MNCPNCGKEMQKGTLHSKGFNYFLPDGEKTPWAYTKASLAKRNAIPLPPNPYVFDFGGDDWPEAHACRDCRQIIIRYGE